VFNSVLCLFPAGILLVFFMLFTEILTGEIPNNIIVIEFILSYLIVHPFIQRWNQENYRYAMFSTRIPFPIDSPNQDPSNYFQQLFDEVFTYIQPEKDVEVKGNYSILSYAFADNSCSLELIIPNTIAQGDDVTLMLLVIEEEDMPRLVELKDLVGMTLGITDLE